jgi:hypothetical protein
MKKPHKRQKPLKQKKPKNIEKTVRKSEKNNGRPFRLQPCGPWRAVGRPVAQLWAVH